MVGFFPPGKQQLQMVHSSVCVKATLAALIYEKESRTTSILDVVDFETTYIKCSIASSYAASQSLSFDSNLLKLTS